MAQRGRPPADDNTLTRRDLARELAKILGTSSGGAQVTRAYFAELQSILADGGDISIHNLGRFSTSAKGARQGRNPRTGETSMIASRRVVHFKPSARLRNRIRARIEDE